MVGRTEVYSPWAGHYIFFQYLIVGGIYKLSPWAGHYTFLSLFNGGWDLRIVKMGRPFNLSFNILWWVGYKNFQDGQVIISFFQYFMVGGIYKLLPWAGRHFFFSIFNGG